MRFPANVSKVRKEYGFNAGNVFTTTNPKTEKNGKVSDMPTIVLHLEPISHGVCPAAGSCAALCLNKAGNPVYLNNKLSRRQKRSMAFVSHRNAFLELVVIEAARNVAKGYKGVRLNGTSDIAWEREQVMISQETSDYVMSLSGRYIQPGAYSVIVAMLRLGLLPYDYTKRIDRDFDTARYLGYHLTLSWGGKHDGVIFDVAERHGLNVAAPVYGIKKSAKLPDTITHNGKAYNTIDGDITDFRKQDPCDKVYIVGLRLKKTPNQTEELAKRFCIA